LSVTSESAFGANRAGCQCHAIRRSRDVVRCSASSRYTILEGTCGPRAPTDKSRNAGTYQEIERGCTPPLDKHLAKILRRQHPPVRRCSWPQRLLKSSSAWAEDRALLGSNPSAVPGAGSKWGAALLPPLALRCLHRRVPAGPLAFSTKAKNPRGSGGLVPRLSKHCLQSASTLLLSPRDPQILLTSRFFLGEGRR